MKKILFLLTILAITFNVSKLQSKNIILTVADKGDIVTEEIKVSGNCGMCKDRIEKATKALKGVDSAIWDSKTKILTVSYDKSLVKSDDIYQAIATAGHDTEKVKASNKTYNKLHGCCKYRK